MKNNMKNNTVRSHTLFGQALLVCGLLPLSLPVHADDINARPEVPNESDIKSEIQAQYTQLTDQFARITNTENEKSSSQNGVPSYQIAIKSLKWNGEHLAEVESVIHEKLGRYVDTEGRYGKKGQSHTLDTITRYHDTWRWQSNWEGFRWVSRWEEVKNEVGSSQLEVDGKVYKEPVRKQNKPGGVNVVALPGAKSK